MHYPDLLDPQSCQRIALPSARDPRYPHSSWNETIKIRSKRGNPSTSSKRGLSSGVDNGLVPAVRIHFPPPASLYLLTPQALTSEKPAFTRSPVGVSASSR